MILFCSYFQIYTAAEYESNAETYKLIFPIILGFIKVNVYISYNI